MSITPEFLDELRHRLPVSQVVGRHVQLKRQGREFAGLSPFNKEKTPSFTVNDQKQFYHCFSSGKHGDIISFVMEVEGLSFPEAVESLAAQAGMEVPKPTPQQAEQAERAKTLHDICEAACVYFEASLQAPEGRAALEYVRARGLDDATIARFRIGYAPGDRQAMRQVLKDQGFDDAMMIEAGLVKKSEYGNKEPFAFFSNRLLFPVTDRRGRVVAFGGRLLDGDGPKYLNSPDTPLFHKSKLLYNMASARQYAGKGHTVIVVEGYMDVIAMARAGFEGAVAPLGTALTEDQIAEAWRIAGTGGAAPILCFDGDAAGQRAAFRAVERVLPYLQPDKTVRFATMPAGEDPDSLIKSGGKQQLLACLKQTEALVDKLWQMELQSRELTTPEAWAGLKAALGKRVATIEHAELQRFYADEMYSRVKDASYQQRQAKRGGNANAGGYGGSYSGGRRFGRGGVPLPPPVKPRKPVSSSPFEYRVILKTLINHPGLIDEYEAAVCDLVMGDPGLSTLRDQMIDVWADDPEVTAEALADALSSRGLDDVLGRLQQGQGIEVLGFAKPSAPLREARKGLAEAFAHLHRKALGEELSQTARRFGVTEEAAGDDDIDRWRSLHEELDQARLTAHEGE